MDKEYEKERFESLSIKAPVAKKFKHYCKEISKSQSMALLLMLEFFENNGISLDESIGPHIQTLENLIKKRINGVIAILRTSKRHKPNQLPECLWRFWNKPNQKRNPRSWRITISGQIYPGLRNLITRIELKS